MATFQDAPTVLQSGVPTAREERVASVAPSAEALASAARYQVGDVLGLGGMGEVRRCHDVRVGRDVAMKTIRGDAAEVAGARERFLREARVQGQLEHPCVVPVYDLGVGDDGEAFFTMKRVRGETLLRVLERLATGDAATAARWTRRRLLVAFVTVCGAIEYAHARGVVHRDLKPANIMLGDFGEVYLLDWGVARICDAPDDAQGELVLEALPEVGRTVAGAVIGTAGYMPVEQFAGADDLDGRADVYALGAILFEVLTLQALHRGDTLQQLIASTVRGADARASLRAPEREIPVELDEVCVKATARERRARYASAQELREAVERFLDGDRDLERRRAQARELAARAEAAAARVDAGEEGARGEAMRAVGQALALDPGQRGALSTFIRLLVAPPKEVPAEAEARIRAAEDAQRVGFYRSGAAGYAIWLALTPLAFWVGVRDAVTYAVLVALVGAAAGLCYAVARTGRGTLHARALLLALSIGAIAASGRILGPFVLTPALSVVVTIIFILSPDRAWRRPYLAAGMAGVVLPVVVELSGVVAPSYVFRDGLLEVHPRVLELPAAPVFAAMVAVHLGVVAAAATVAARLRDVLDDAARRVHLQAWQLRQIVPATEDGG